MSKIGKKTAKPKVGAIASCMCGQNVTVKLTALHT